MKDRQDITVYLNRIFVKSKTKRNGNVKSRLKVAKSKERNFFYGELFFPNLRLRVKVFSIFTAID